MRNLKVKLRLLLLPTFIILSTYFSFAQQAFDKSNNGVVVHVRSVAPGSAKTVKLQVVNDNIIRVSTIPGDDFSNDTSLIIVYKNNGNNQFTTEQNGDTVYLKTNTLTVRISTNNGSVSFTKSDGTPILQEKRTAEPTFTTAVFDGQPLYHINQTFQTTDDDAWYGLG